MGHTEGASEVAGIIKTILMMQNHAKVPIDNPLPRK